MAWGQPARRQHAANEPALKLYEGLGFNQVGRRPKYYRDGGDAVLLTLDPGG